MAINYTVNSCYEPLFYSKKRYHLIMGGRNAGRSYAASQLIEALMRGLTGKQVRIAIMRQNHVDIRSSIYQSCLDFFESSGFLNEPSLQVIDSRMVIKYKPNGKSYTNMIVPKAFRTSTSQTAKLKSLAGFTHIFIEEAEEVNSFEAFNNLDESVRDIIDPKTREVLIRTQLYLLCNPPEYNHWIVRNYLKLWRDKTIPENIGVFYTPKLTKKAERDWLFIHSTYKDNIKNISDQNLRKIKNNKETSPDYYYEKILGLISRGKTGLIYKNFVKISLEEYNAVDSEIFYGLDFGFSKDPAALIEIKKKGTRLYVRQIIYERGLTNADIFDLFVDKVPNATEKTVYPDSAEAKSIEEMKRYGMNVIAAEKGSDSVRAGIRILQGYTIFYTEDSKDIEKELESYVWALGKNKEPTNRPIDENNHALDALRYAVITRYHGKQSGIWEALFPSN
jgi:phage terminase large subunit